MTTLMSYSPFPVPQVSDHVRQMESKTLKDALDFLANESAGDLDNTLAVPRSTPTKDTSPISSKSKRLGLNILAGFRASSSSIDKLEPVHSTPARPRESEAASLKKSSVKSLFRVRPSSDASLDSVVSNVSQSGSVTAEPSMSSSSSLKRLSKSVSSKLGAVSPLRIKRKRSKSSKASTLMVEVEESPAPVSPSSGTSRASGSRKLVKSRLPHPVRSSPRINKI